MEILKYVPFPEKEIKVHNIEKGNWTLLINEIKFKNKMLLKPQVGIFLSFLIFTVSLMSSLGESTLNLIFGVTYNLDLHIPFFFTMDVNFYQIKMFINKEPSRC